MAELVVSVVAERILDVFIQESELLNGVENQLEWIEKELRLIHTSSLEQESSEWAVEASNLVAEVDDIINIFLNESARKRGNPLSALKRFFARYKFALKLEKIKAKIRRASKTRTRQEGLLMAATASGQLAASISVFCVINEANLVLSQNLLVIGGLTQEVEDILDEFLRLQGILKNVQEKGELDERTNAWLDEVLEVSDTAKNVFGSFRREREELLPVILNMGSLILNDLGFGRAISRISNALQNMYERRWRYGIGDHSDLSKRPNSINLKKPVKYFSFPFVLGLYPLPASSLVMIGTLQLGKEVALLRPVENQLKSINRDLELMKALINDVQGKEALDQRVVAWLDEIKDIKRHADNLLDFASYNQEQDTPRGILKNPLLVIKSTLSRPKVWKKIEQINNRIHEVSVRKWTYDIGKIEGNSKNSQPHLQEGESSITEVASTAWNAMESIKWELKLMKALFADIEPIEDQDERVKLWVEIMQSVAKDAQKLIDTYDTRNMAVRSGIKRYLFILLNKSKLIEKISGGLHDISIIKSTYAIGGIEGRRGLNSTDETQHEILPTASAISETPTASTTILAELINALMASINLSLDLDVDVKDVELIKREKWLLDALFKDVGDQERLDRTQKDWVEAMRAVANDVNSAIAMCNEMTRWNFFQRVAAAEKIRFVASKIRDMPQRVPYGIKHIKRSEDSNIGSPHKATTASFGLEEPDINLYDDLQAVKMQLLVDNEHHVTVIVGMEGVGKTTLAKLICEDDDVKFRFPHCALASIPSYESTSALVNYIKQSTGIQELEGEVIDANTCLIVLDDVRTTDVWDELKKEFLSRFNGIRILVTTRSLGVATHADPTSVSHKLHLLSDDDSWLLFKHSLTIPPGLEEQDIRTEVLIPCGGLPKTIVEVREQFSHVEPTCEAWLRLLKMLKRNEEPWQETKSIIQGNIPLSWRRCLFVIAQFRTDFEIPVRRLIALWIAEGVVRQMRVNPGNSPQDSPESIAKRYLSELIDRNMVQVTKKKLNGDVKRCRLPHPLQELLRTRKNSHLVDYYNPNDLVFKNAHDGNENISTSSLSSYNDVISFTSFDTREGSTPGEELGKFLNICISRRCLMTLRVLDLEQVFRPQLPKAIGKLVRLRYLGLRWTYLETLPSFISKLLNLQILDVKHTSISTLPRSIWRMHQLRHLYLNDSYRCRLASPRNFQTITDLQTLWGVFIDEESPVKYGLDTFRSLKRLGLTSHLMASEYQNAMLSRLEAVADWVEELKQLQSLRLKSLDESNQPWYLPLKPLLGHTSLSSIYLLGRIKNKFVSGLPQGITELTLSGSGLKKDPMRTLKDLPSLKILRLLGDSFIGRHMLCSSKGFLQLRVLKLWKLMHLEEWKLTKGALPNLIDLEIRSCIKLKVLPNGLLFLSTLPSLKLSGMPKEFIRTIKVNQIHQWDISDISDTSAILTSKRPKKFVYVKEDASTSQNLSLFEDPISAQESNSYHAPNSFLEENVHQTQSTMLEYYRSLFHWKLGQYIRDVKDVQADGNCGFRAVAVSMGMEEDSWLQVRQKLTGELIDHRADYVKIYEGEEKVDKLLHRLNTECSPANKEYWMTFPDMGHLIASAYGVVLVFLSTLLCITFLPLRSMPSRDRPPEVIVIGHINCNHFVKVSMSSDLLVPPISVTWSENRDACADGWQTPYIDRIKKFEDLMDEDDVATRESFPKGEETVGNEIKDGYHDNGAAAKECSKDGTIPNTT